MEKHDWKPEFPGGRPEATDDSLEDALRREVREELGVEIGGIMRVFSMPTPGKDGGPPHWTTFYSATITSGEMRSPEGRTGWFTRDDLMSKGRYAAVYRAVFEVYDLWLSAPPRTAAEYRMERENRRIREEQNARARARIEELTRAWGLERGLTQPRIGILANASHAYGKDTTSAGVDFDNCEGTTVHRELLFQLNADRTDFTVSERPEEPAVDLNTLMEAERPKLRDDQLQEAATDYGRDRGWTFQSLGAVTINLGGFFCACATYIRNKEPHEEELIFHPAVSGYVAVFGEGR
jgi:8-oxo-dGTP pyrophosphatase MutT (NUDIX family)